MGCGCAKRKNTVQKYGVYDKTGKKVGPDYVTRSEALQEQGKLGPGASVRPITSTGSAA